MLAACLLAMLLALISQTESLHQTVLLAALIALPLLDRTRFYGLALGAGAGGILTVWAIDIAARTLPAIPNNGAMLMALFSASAIGLIASLMLPLHTSRITAEGLARRAPRPDATLATGWIILLLILLTIPYEPSRLIAGISAAFFALAATRYGVLPQSLETAAQAFVAGTILTLLSPLSFAEGLLAGMLAAFCVVRSEGMAHAIRLDDPARMVGTLVFPALFGLLLPGVLSSSQLAAEITALAAACAITLMISLILWPAVMLLVGLELPGQRKR